LHILYRNSGPKILKGDTVQYLCFSSFYNLAIPKKNAANFWNKLEFRLHSC